MRHFQIFALSFTALYLAGCGGSSGGEANASDPVEQLTENLNTNTILETDDSGIGSVIAIGDSFFEWNSENQRSIPDEIGKKLGISVQNNAVGGAHFLGEPSEIPAQYSEDDWQWVVINGGGNDLNERCGCSSCDAVMDSLVSSNGLSGSVQSYVSQLVTGGKKVIYMGYPELPGGAEFGFDQCSDELAEMGTRLNLMAAFIDNAWFVSAKDVVPDGDPGFFDSDRVHPSELGSMVIGEYIANQIRSQTP